ncbi:MAG: alpha/beta hydrolase [Actinomycetia bacterium]|nr:alpha/beta hydrolase [Actinomycetes bacterium]
MTQTTQLTVNEAGAGRPVLILHGGGGPATVAGIAAHLSGGEPPAVRTLTPTHPGWDGTPRPAWCTGIGALASGYLRLLAERGLRDVVVVGSSLGGWTAAEMAARDTAGLVGGLVLIDAVGIHVDGEPVADFFGMDPRTAAAHSWHDPDRFFVDPAALPAAQRAVRAGNQAATQVLTGDPAMADPGLRDRLAAVDLPVLVLWGASDRVVTPVYGAAYARAFPRARFQLVADAGHLPHIEQPAVTFGLLDAYLAGLGSDLPAR